MKSILIGIGLLVSLSGFSQEIPYPPLSPRGTITQVIGNTTFEFDYSRPSVRGREIFGELVPFGEVWRTGADACTTISFNRPVKVFDQEIPAGKYSLFTKPGPSEWMIMINEDADQRGTRDYDSGKDVIQILAETEKSRRFYETFTIDIEMIDNNARIWLSWAETRVAFLLETSTNDIINALIKSELLTDKSQDADQYFGGADFLKLRGEDNVMAYELATKAVKLDPDSEAFRNLKIELAEKIENYADGIKEIDALIAMLQSIGNRAKEISALKEKREDLTKLLKKQK